MTFCCLVEKIFKKRNQNRLWVNLFCLIKHIYFTRKIHLPHMWYINMIIAQRSEGKVPLKSTPLESILRANVNHGDDQFVDLDSGIYCPNTSYTGNQNSPDVLSPFSGDGSQFPGAVLIHKMFSEIASSRN